MSAQAATPRKRGRPPLGEVTSVRFPPELHEATRQIAAREGKHITEWLREVIGAEIARREGKCRACGQPLPDPWSEP